ncbi:MAG: aminopeptidase P N-terminal domain-containing protein [Odoribacteraceae bacterium]|jgi:Xaa-Pro aminopeptidase|nr:aminopeptidase P N-terminal domain-containing protein [Odoribacteraceae bacterium]
MFEKEVYQNRRSRLREEVGHGLLLFIGNNECGMNYADNTYPFRQDSTFLYFFGIDRPGLTALVDVDEGKEMIFGDDPTMDDIVWMGAQPTLRARGERVGIDRAAPARDLKTHVANARARGRVIHYLPPYRADHYLFLCELLGMPPAAASLPFIRAVVNQRNYKSPAEIEQIEQAVDISADMHLAAMRLLRPGMKESEIAAAVTAVALRDGGQLAFPVIATINGQTLHNHHHHNVTRDGQLFLLDAGAENAMHYAGDLSSTFPVGTRFTEPQKVIYNIALAAHRAAVAALRPGIPFKEVHFAAAAAIVDGMKEIGLMHGETAAAVQAGAHALFFPCGTGHMMGLDVHDMENLGEEWVGYDGEPKSTLFGLKSLRLARVLEPGFVFTIEPGIYFIPELIDRWRSEKRFQEYIHYDRIAPYMHVGGVRNEEDYLVTTDGKRRLGKYIPTTVEEVEQLRGGA